METTLIIAEKPSVARDIAAALGGFKKGADGLEKPGFLISNALGHLVHLTMPLAATTGGDLETLPVMGEFTTELNDEPGSKAQYRVLERLLNRPDVATVVNACDAGREGELIFRLIYQHAKCRKPIKRMWIQSMTEDGLREAYRKISPGTEYDALAAAARARSEADFLVGINGSRAVSQLRERQVGRREQMTTGRVQSPTLGLLVERERQIRNFVPKDYWEIHATFGAKAGRYMSKWFDPRDQRTQSLADADDDGENNETDEANNGKRFYERGQAEAIVAKCKGVAPSSVTDTSKRTTKAAPKLYSLTDLQQDAARKFKFSSMRTLNIAQALYETHKVTTYPRTDSNALPEDYVEKVHELIEGLSESAYASHAKRVLDSGWIKPDKRIFNNKEISDHFAIIPTGTKPAGLDADEQKIFDLIALRFLAVFHPAAEFDVTNRVTVVAGESFKSSGTVQVSRGWMEVYGAGGADPTKALCAVDKGEVVSNLGMEVVTLKTTPPSRYKEETLLQAMKRAGRDIADEAMRAAIKGGLGTSATRASIIEGLLSKGSRAKPKEPYAIREKDNYFVPTEKAMGLFTFLDDNQLRDMASVEMTGDWEHRLGLVAEGKYSSDVFLQGIKDMVSSWMEKIRGQVNAMPAVEVPKLVTPCPSCGKPVAGLPQLVECTAKCGFKLWRNCGGKVLTDQQMNQILKDGVLLNVELISKAKRPYKTNLRLNLAERKIDFEFPDRPEGATRASAPDPSLLPVLDVRCPKCKGTVRIHDGDNPKFACEKGDWTFWRTIAKRVLSPSEGLQLLRHGEMPAVTGFVGSKGKFAAGLKLSRDKTKAEFVFEGR